VQVKPLISAIRMRNFLSFGEEVRELPLGTLNVLIGPNASGKSNLIDAISLLAALPKDAPIVSHLSGGVGDWLWKGSKKDPIATIEVDINDLDDTMPSEHRDLLPLLYSLQFTRTGQLFQLIDEKLENKHPVQPGNDVYFYYRYQKGRPVLNACIPPESEEGEHNDYVGRRRQRHLERDTLKDDQSILSQRKDPDSYPEITYVGNKLSRIRVYREWDLGRNTAPRLPQSTDLPGDFLLEDASNLSLVMNDLKNRPLIKTEINKKLRDFSPAVDTFETQTIGGTIQIYFHEKGLAFSVPATRLSDGTLRFLCLLSILCHPSPPPLICIEEPELGLHPDILPTVAELLIEASKRTQLIISTHSDIIVSALSEHPEAVIVCERDENGTIMKRLDASVLKDWLDKYTLGELWQMGEIGGNRW
jgi:predicted ATPase